MNGWVWAWRCPAPLEWKLGVGFENATAHPSAGDILFYPGGYSETEILWAYGACSFASKLGPLAVGVSAIVALIVGLVAVIQKSRADRRDRPP